MNRLNNIIKTVGTLLSSAILGCGFISISHIYAKDDTKKKQVVILKSKDEMDETNIFEEKYKSPSNVKIITSKLGVKIFHKLDKSAPLVHIKIAFRKSGTSYQKKEKMGVPDLYSSTVFYGCGKYSAVQFDKELMNIASNVSCYCNQDILAFSMTAPTIVLDEAINLLNTAIVDPKFEKEKVKVAQNSMVAGMQNYAQNPVIFAKNIFILSLIFKDHIYGNGVCGSAENIATITIDDLKKYKQEYIVLSNAEACVCGDVSEEKTIAIVDKIFAGLDKGKPAADIVHDVTPAIRNITKKYYAEGPQSTIVFAMKTERVKSPKRYAAVVLSRILGGQSLFKSRIMSILRSKLGLIYGGSTSIVDLDHASYLIGVLKTDNSKVERAIAALRDIIKNIRENVITQTDLDFAKSNMIGTMLVALRTSEDMCAFYFSAMRNGYGANALNEILNKIYNVSLNDVQKLSKEIFDENNITIVVIGGNAQ